MNTFDIVAVSVFGVILIVFISPLICHSIACFRETFRKN